MSTGKTSVSTSKFREILINFNRLIKKHDSPNPGSHTVNPDFARPYLSTVGLDSHIVEFRRDKNVAQVPLKYRGVYERFIGHIVVLDLDIHFDSPNLLSWDTGEYPGVEHFNWHFYRCRFIDLGSVEVLWFGWAKCIRFANCSFHFRHDGLARNLSFFFQNDSTVVFSQNDFGGGLIQVQDGREESKGHGLYSISFIGNRRAELIQLICHAKRYEFYGSNSFSCLTFSEQAVDYELKFGPFEQIDRNFTRPDHHRRLFLGMRKRATEDEDFRQVRILDSYIEAIDYYLLKVQGVRGKRIEYLQTRFFFFLRKWTTNYHRVWLRPLVIMIVGYGLLNLLPGLFIENFAASEWLLLCASPLKKTPQHLENILDLKYAKLSVSVKAGLGFIGVGEVLWLAGCGIMIRKALRSL